MSKRVIFSSCALFLVLLYFKLPHLLWLPGILFSYFNSQGYIFFKDFLNFHFPLSTFFILPFYLVSNWDLRIEPVMSLLISLATLFVLYKTCVKFLSSKSTTVCLIFFTLLYFYFTTAVQYNLESIIGLFMATLSFYLFSISQSKIVTPSALLLGGLLIGLAELFGQIVTLPLVVVFFIVVSILWRKKSIRQFPTKGIMFLLIGILLPIAALVLYFTLKGALGDLLYYNITYYLTYLKLANSGGSVVRLPWGDIIMFYTPLILSGILLLFRRKTFSKNILVRVTILTLISALTIPSVIFSVFHPHHFLYALPILSLLSGQIFEVALISRASILLTLLTGIFLLYQAAFSLLPWYTQKIIANKGAVIINDSNPGDRMYDAATWVKNNTPVNSTILVAGDGLFYFKSHRLPSTKYHVILPWHYQPLDQTKPIIQKNRPDYWVVGEGYLERISSPQGWNSPAITSFIQEELTTCYKEELRLPEWLIYKKLCS